MNLNFKIPVVNKSNNRDERQTLNWVSDPSKTRWCRGDQIVPVGGYSTVKETTPKDITPNLTQQQYSFCLSVEVKSSSLWVSKYTPYQQKLYDIICKKHEEDGWNFKQISDWFIKNNYLSTRGKTLKQNHVWSIYQKKQRSIKRFSRQYPHDITSIKIDVVDVVPKPT